MAVLYDSEQISAGRPDGGGTVCAIGGAIIDGVMPAPLHIHWLEKAILPVMGDL